MGVHSCLIMLVSAIYVLVYSSAEIEITRRIGSEPHMSTNLNVLED